MSEKTEAAAVTEALVEMLNTGVITRSIRVKYGKVTVKHDDGTLMSVEVDPRADGRLVKFVGEFIQTEEPYLNQKGNMACQARFAGKASLVPQLSIGGLTAEKPSTGGRSL